MELEIATVFACEDEYWLEENTGKISEVLEIFSFLIRMFAACVYIFAKIHRLVHLRSVNTNVCIFYLKRNIKKENSERKHIGGLTCSKLCEVPFNSALQMFSELPKYFFFSSPPHHRDLFSLQQVNQSIKCSGNRWKTQRPGKVKIF